MELENLIVKIGKILDKKNIPYMIIGGQAVQIYGEPRLTKDIDITIGLDIDLYNLLIDAIKKIGLIPLIEDIENFIKDTYVLPTYDKKTDFRIDFIFSNSKYEKEALKRVNKIKIKNYEINFASLEDLIIHKIISGRERDIEDIKNILIKNKYFDKEYIKKWLQEFQETLNENLIEKFENLIKIFNHKGF
ncbi:MAG: nucleotidyltransferase [Caldisericia bacterium]|nr:nucleotidyltransferase [Caldisericia bacterium]